MNLKNLTYSYFINKETPLTPELDLTEIAKKFKIDFTYKDGIPNGINDTMKATKVFMKLHFKTIKACKSNML